MELEHQLEGVWCYIEKKLTWTELKKVATVVKDKGIIKANPINIPKNDRYDRIIIAKRRTWERLGVWLNETEVDK